MTTRERKIGSYIAVDDADNEYKVHAFVDEVDASSSDGVERVAGRQRARLDDGTQLDYRGPGEYAIMPAGLIIRAESPPAP